MLLKIKRVIDGTRLLTIALILVDAIAVVFAFITAYFLRDKGIFRFFLGSIQPIEVYFRVLPAVILLLLFIFALFGLYEPKQRATKISEMYKSFQAVTLWILLIMAGSYLYKVDYSRIVVLQLYFYTLVFIAFGRLLVRQLQIRLLSNGFGQVNILIIGTGRQAQEIAERLQRYKLVGFNLVDFVHSDKLSSLNTLIKKYNIDEVYIADPTLSQQKILNLIAKCPYKNTKFKITSKIFDLITGSVDIRNLEAIPSLDLSRAYFPFWKRIYKRIFDVIVAGIGFIVSSPFWLIIVLLIKLDSKGSAIISQTRIGLNGRQFKMYKFRTMHNNAMLFQKSPRDKDDSRITKIGRFLRSTSLDELPQIINILKGEMSIVGPRPEMPFIVKRYSEWEKKRLLVKPGLTGLWQILGRKDLPLSENLEYDFYYINNHSLILDLVIILKTIPVVLLGKGAY